jgi:hypothetical protein
MTRPLTRAHLKKGRPLKLAPEGAAARIEALAADGFSIVGVAKGMGTSKETLAKWFDADPALTEAFDQGREQERHALHNMLYRQAMEQGNTVAALFLLKARHGYREGDQGETGNRVQITFALPGAMTMQDFKVVENERDNTTKRLPTETAIAA